MKTLKQFREACWSGYKRKKGTQEYEKGSCVREDGVAVAGPTNAVSSGAIAGSGGAGGEPGVHLKKKNPIILPMGKRKSPV
jgi:hypothetical protein